MSQRTCDKCGETVSLTKAFCPACGHVLVEEETREDTSEFQQLDGTMQFGKTMYNQMLSEMGLNISVPAEQLSEAVKPVVAEVSQPSPTPPVRAEVIQPITTEKLKPAAAPAPARKDKTKMLLIIGGVIVVAWALLILVVAFFAILPRLR